MSGASGDKSCRLGQEMTIFRPDALIDRIREMRGHFREYGLGMFRLFIFNKASLRTDA